MAQMTPAEQQREELAKRLDAELRFYDLREAAAVGGRHRQQLQRLISQGRITFFVDQDAKPKRYLIHSRQVAAIVRAGPYGKPVKVQEPHLKAMRQIYGQRIR